MPKGGRRAEPSRAESFRHDEETRKNIPEAGLIEFVPKVKEKKTQYCWDPRESPQLIWAGKAGMNKVEVEEKTSLEIPLVNLHIHERVSTEAIIKSAQRQDAQKSLFADPELEFKDEIKFYQHDVNWSNRMILGDSLLVMNSLLEREGMRGSVQCIYMDPPYGIKYASNFQPRIDQRDVKDGKDDDLTREVMQVQAFRDTWELGVHSYLTYLRDRLLLARELLKDEGSIFVQIGDENVHRVRCLMDEVFGEENFCAVIPFLKTSGAGSPAVGTKILPKTTDYILWFAKQVETVKYRQLYLVKEVGGEGSEQYSWLQESSGLRRKMTKDEADGFIRLPEESEVFRPDNLTSQTGAETTTFPVQIDGVSLRPTKGGWKTNAEGMKRLSNSSRLLLVGKTPCYVRFIADFPAFPLTELWDDTRTSGFADAKAYAVQTNAKVIERCILMTTDPGDLVLDPTCGSGTTAYVAEQWGRRWITMDTSRVALALARHRLMTADFDYYKLRHPTSGVSGGFVYKTVPHITLKSIAQNTEIDKIAAEFQPQIAKALAALNKHLKTEYKEWEVPRPTQEPRADESSSSGLLGEVGEKNERTEVKQEVYLCDAHREFWRLKREMQSQIDASIARNAPTEELVDQPMKESGIVRVSGPFTMEALPEYGEIRAEVEIETIPTDDGKTQVAEFSPAMQTEAENVGAYLGDMVEQLRKSGVFTSAKRPIKFLSVRALDHEVIHAEGEFEIENGEADKDSDLKALKGKQVKCAIMFGPQNGALSEVHVRDAVRAAGPYDALLFCAYEFTAPAQEVINSDPVPGKRLLMATIAPDTAMLDLLKNTKASQLFTLVGEPDVIIYRHGDESLPALLKDAERRGAEDVLERAKSLKPGEVFVELRGVDLYNPLTGEVEADSGANIHAFFLDHDYDGKSFCICQAMFPNKKDSWDKIARNLKGTIDEEAFSAFRTLVSLPFKPGAKIQVKVIDARGNAIVKTVGA